MIIIKNFNKKKVNERIENDYRWGKNNSDRDVALQTIKEQIKKADDLGVPVSRESVDRYAAKHGLGNTNYEKTALERLKKQGNIKSENNL